MTSHFDISTVQLVYGAAAIIVFIGLLILAGKYFITKRSRSNLSEKYKDKVWKSPLEGRSKYPDVDIFRHSGAFTRLGLAITLALTIGLFNWTTFDKEVIIPDDALVLEEEISIEPPRTAEPPPPPPPPPPPVIQEVPDEVVMEDEDPIEFMDQSIEAESVVEAPPPVVDEGPKETAPPPPPPPPVEEEVEEIFKVVEEMPRFPGCEDIAGTSAEKKSCAEQKLLQFIYENIKYPTVARENGIQGNVVVRFVVNRDGSVVNTEILRDIGGGCGEEAVRVVNLMNDRGIKWIPGRQRGRAVRVMFMLPIKFKLEES